MKKTVSIILAILMIVTTIPMAFAADIVSSGTFYQTNIEWAFDSDNVLTISGEGGMGSYAGFASNPNIKNSTKEVIIEEGVTEIVDSLFLGWPNLTSVYIADSVETIGVGAFRNCDALTRICIGSGVKKIGSAAFNASSLYTKKVIHYNGTESMWNNITKDSAFYLTPDLHYLEKSSKPATCFEDGQEVLVCTQCNDTFKSKVIPASHTLEAVEAKAPTCTEAGYDAYEYCTACDYTTYVELPASHTLETVEAKAPTCTEIGWDAYEYCTACDYSTYVELPASHTLETVEAQAPACTEIGWDAYEYCTACDYTTYVEKAALDHDIVIDEAVAPKCGETGLTQGQHCSRCDAMTIVQETVPSLTHTDADGDYKCDHGCGYEFEKPAEPEADCACGKEHNNFFDIILCFLKGMLDIISDMLLGE